MFKKILLNEKGSAVILVVIGMTMLLGIVSLVTDVGLIFISKFDLVNAVDAATLAGAQELPENPQGAIEVARDYAIANGVIDNNLNIELLNDNRSIRVDASRIVNLLFAKILGFNTGFVNHYAVAQVAPVTAIEGITPLSIIEQELVFGEQYNLKVGGGSGEQGWFHALRLGGSGADIYEDNLTYGYQATLSIGDIVDIESGNMSNPTKRAIDFHMVGCNHIPYCTAESYQRDCGRLVRIPVVEMFNEQSVRIKGFAMFLLDDVTAQGNDCYVNGKFVKTIVSGEVSEEAEDYGLLGVKLMQ